MRNLKRALSLALASVMLMGMMVVGSSAASYPDVDSNDNTEAIAVLNAVEVMIGNENGEFEPDKNVTRNEMAVILAKLILGKDADKYVGTCPFTDVPEWAQKYVAACYDNKIVAGRTESLYDGNATVTAQEAAAMVLRVLGYEKLESTGTNWAQPVVAKANEIRLFAGVGSSATAPMTRNQVAQLSLNALETTMVTSKVDQDIIIDGVVTIPGKVEYTERTVEISGPTDAACAIKGPDAPTKGDKVTLQLGEYLYDGDLKLETSDITDDFGRPASTWKYDDEDVYTVADDADKMYIGGVKAKDIYKDLGLSAEVDTDEINYYEDSASSEDGAQAINSTNGEKYGADGQVVYVYYDKDEDKPVTISVISSYLGVVVDEEFTEDDKDGIRIDVLGPGGGLKFFEATGYAEGDLVLVTISDGDIYEIVGEPETVTGEITRVGSDNALTIDSKKYPQASKFDDEADGDVIKGVDTFTAGNSYTLYLDRNGCYLAVALDENNATTDLVYVYAVESKLAVSGSTGAYKPVATVVMMDGTCKDVPLGDNEYNDSDASDSSAVKTAADALVGTLADLKYDEDDDVYTLAASGDYTSNNINTASAIELAVDDRYAKLDGSVNTYLNDETVYVFIEENDGNTKINDVQTVTGGVDFTIESGKTGVFAVETGKSTAKYVVVKAPYEASNKDIVYIKDGTLKGSVKGGFTFEGYYGTNSKKVELPIYSVNGTAVDKDAAGTYPDANTFYTYTTKNDGTLKLSAAGVNAKMNQTIESIENGLLDVGGAKPYKTANMVMVDLTDKTDGDVNAYGANVTNLTALRKVVNMTSPEYTVTVDMYVNSDDEIVALFIQSILVDNGDDGSGEGTPAELVAALDFSKTDGGAAPAWAPDDTVQFVATGGDVTFDLTFKAAAARAVTWALDTDATNKEPAGWSYSFNGSSLTLTQETASDLDTHPFGTIAPTVTADGKAVSGVTVDDSAFTEGSTGESDEPGEAGTVALDKTTLTLDAKTTKTGELTATFTEGTDKLTAKSYAWTTSDDKVATVEGKDTKGTVTYVGEGKATITCTVTLSDDQTTVEATCEVTCEAEQHVCSAETLSKVEAVAGKDCQTKGTGAYYKCTCNKMYSDAEAQSGIQAVPEGELGEHDYALAPVENNAKQHVETCTVCESSEGKSPVNHDFKVETSKHVCGCGAEHADEYASESEGADCKTKETSGCTLTKPGA